MTVTDQIKILDRKIDKKEGLLKRLKNIENKKEELLKAKNKTENIKEVTGFVDEPLGLEARDLNEEIRVIQKDVDHRKFKLRGGNNTDQDFSDYKTFKGFYYKKIAIDEAEREQYEFNAIIGVLEDYTQRNNKYIEAKNKFLNNLKKIYEGKEKLLKGIKTEYSHLIKIKRMRKK